ncbi:MAG: bacterial proteasome activator family protein [Actinobacteria bacterium]|nr:bacterial proteasome activator family protein [Actinomycetota bacterium]
MDSQSVKPDNVESEEEKRSDDAAVSHPGKLIRIAAMTRAMLEEVRQSPLDEGGRERLVSVHSKSLEELRPLLSDELQEEFNEIMIPLDGDAVTESELRVAQAQLIGWLEGLFHGIQATLWSQQMAAQSQLAELQKRALGRPGPGEDGSSGLYL